MILAATLLPFLSPRHADTNQQTRAEAKEHYTQKATFVQDNLDKLQKTIERKNENVQMVVQVLQMKMQQGGGAGQGQAVAA